MKFGILFCESECVAVAGNEPMLLWAHLRNENDQIVSFNSVADAEKIKQIMMDSGEYPEEEKYYEIEELE